ncbi:hypothetical protein ACFZDJ_08725 [Streptomyces sp. NPDC007896]|uniref:hypothetical protein n=1 Tax=Streptomyces sp. NPDC007896 TaxID=3364784 RepID=UPI0036EDCB3E
MVTSTHEVSHRIFAEHPEALTPVYEALGVPPPTKADIREITPDATEIRPLERRVDTVLKDTLAYWFETMEIALANTPARAKWRELHMSVGSYYPGQGTLIEEKYLEGKAEGEARGEAKDRAGLILRVLEKHGVDVPEDVRDRVISCTDLDTLMLWFDRSLTATTAEDLFTENEDGQAEGSQNQTSA